MSDTSFPLYCTVQPPFPEHETYSHSLIQLGHGYSFYKPQGNNARPEEYRGIGASLGDIGIINSRGSFEFILNIFRPLPHDFLGDLPPGFGESPLAPPLSSDEYTITENQFPAGTVLASKGINVSHKSDSPL